MPFTLDDLTSPDSGDPIQPWEFVIVENGSDKKIYIAEEYVDLLNLWEHKLNQVGQSLRHEKVDVMIHNLANPDYWGREMRSRLDMSLGTLADKIMPQRDDCPLVTLQNLGVNSGSGIAYKPDDLVKFENNLSIKIYDAIPKLNEQQKYLCEIGYSLFEGIVPNGNDMLAGLLKNRQGMMEELGIDPFHPVFDLAKWAKKIDYQEMQSRLSDLRMAIENPTPERIYMLSQKYKKGE